GEGLERLVRTGRQRPVRSQAPGRQPAAVVGRQGGRRLIMLAEPAMREHAQEAAPSAPQLRTLLLTDLCDSVALVEKLGDTAAAELFQQHDRLVLQLQQQWKGRLIDRSDGLLLLFERPINGLAFAIDYLRGLRELGRARGLVL